MAANMSVLGLILPSYPYLRSAMIRFPFTVKKIEWKKYCLEVPLWWTKLWWKKIFDETQKLKLWQNSIAQVVTLPSNSNVMKLKTQIVTKLKIQIWKTEIMAKLNKKKYVHKTPNIAKLKDLDTDKIQKHKFSAENANFEEKEK